MNSLPGFASVGTVLGRRLQVSTVVHNLERAARLWSEHLGVGPWIVFEDALEGREFRHRGERSDVRMSLAMTYAGETQLEIISQHNDAPSPYKEFLDSGRQGLQHLEFWPNDYVASCQALERGGFTEISTIHLPDGTKNASYFESPPEISTVVAVVPMTPFRHSYMSVIEHLATTWDGTRPVRSFARRGDFLVSDDFARAERELGRGHA